jgi:hypothetical protein
MRLLALLLCAVGLCACASGPPAPGEAQGEGILLGEGDCTGTGAVTIRVAGRDRVFPFDELRRIHRAVERYLAEEKPRMDPSVIPPGEMFIDCRGRAKMGAWILESVYSSEPELQLSFRVHTGEGLIVRQNIGLEEVDGRWRATGTGLEFAHLHR